MTQFSIDKIAAVIGGALRSVRAVEHGFISSLSIDSRALVDPDLCLFFALVGDRHDGHQYVRELYEKGVRSFVVSVLPADDSSFRGANFIEVKDTLKALQQLAAFVRREFQFPVLAVTGSNGKTIVKEWLFDLLQHEFRILRSPKSYNSQVGVPLSIWNMQGDADLGILEAGISKPGEMNKLAALISPEIGLFTNIGDAHQQSFSSMEEKVLEKLQLFEGAKRLVCRRDQELVFKLASEKFVSTGTRVFSWSTNGLEADIAFVVSTKQQFTQLLFEWNGTNYTVQIPFGDEASLENACHCLALICAEGWLSDSVIRGFESLQAVAMRLELKQGVNGCTLINDFYNTDINSLEIALQFLNQQTSSSDQRKTVILSDIKQSGFAPYQLYTEVNRLLKLNQVSRLIGIGPMIHEHQSVFQMPAQFYNSAREFAAHMKSEDFSRELVLLKGAREFRFESLASLLQKKYHQTQLEINLNTLVDNLNSFRAVIKPETKIMVMVKAFSYGSGTVEIARALEFQKVDYLAVAVADEGIELRQAGIETPILVMNPEEHSFDAMIEYRLEPNIYSLSVFQKFNRVAANSAVSSYPVHIKLETGMNRLGFSDATELATIAVQIQREEILRVQSVFSHLAATDEPLHDAFTRKQYERFRELADVVVSKQKNKVIRHLLNSAGIERFPEFQMDMVRLGIGLYGVAAAAIDVRPIACWTTAVSQVKKVVKDETVGYGRKGRVSQPTKIAVVPVGYADGYDRRFSNGVGQVWVNGVRVPVIGNVCMDMTMIDVSGVDVEAGDLVELMGEHIRLKELANWANTIPYEILTGISQRVRRVYSQE
ncbi:bifunctional UDP-N-acetylmuramoyl-tripeptide:D-alanyl-D-alanine ligase/alanine racemase [Sunxiuqinia sp. sy24]|uniref:bifunctional UDP-N-acetylmuramoyl-tripeptide:D-alanyl-D-alanine ligase/alanine racemase n=1 Tax=Sunxiuqinia sp. sy24 TaxID=3461495 RepID=UPI004045B3C2